MSYALSQKKRAWRCFGRYRRPHNRLRGFLFIFLALEITYGICFVWKPVTLVSQAYSSWECQVEGETAVYGVTIDVRNGKFYFYKKEKILR